MRAYQNHGKSILEIFCKDYDVCLHACCYGKIIINRSELDGSVAENSDFCHSQDGEKSV